jgi:hypothetical protein
VVQRTREELLRLYRLRLAGMPAPSRKPLHLIAGGAPDDDDPEETTEEPDEEPDPEETTEEEPDEEPDKPESKDKKDKGKAKQSSAEAARREREREDAERRSKAKIAAADRRAAESQRRYEDLKKRLDEEKPESERLKGELADSEGEVSRLRGVNRDLALQLAFFKNSRVNWVDPEDALAIAMVQMNHLEVEEDGAVDPEEVRKIITRMTKEKSHLVAKAQPKSGAGVGGGSGKKDGQQAADAARINAMFPALRSRQGQPTTPAQ